LEVQWVDIMLPSPAQATPSGPGWVHEIKHDERETEEDRSR
jgi:hypothetical protein